jgi:hypothetical protein
VLAVLTGQHGVGQGALGQHRVGGECLDTLCTVAGPETVVMRSAVAYSLLARTITRCGDGLRLSHPKPFLEAAAQAMGIDRLRVIETGLAPGRHGTWDGPTGQWDDGANLLVLGPGTVVSYERNALTNARLEAAGIEVTRVIGGELAGCRGGPRAVCSPIGRESAAMPETVLDMCVPGPRRSEVSLPGVGVGRTGLPEGEYAA